MGTKGNLEAVIAIGEQETKLDGWGGIAPVPCRLEADRFWDGPMRI
jgi:hypothetical protein